MIVDLIGPKRTLMLAVFIAVNIAIAAVYFLWLEPMRQNATQQLASLNGQISKLQGKIQDVKRELTDYRRNLPAYEAMQTSGFFSDQDRFQLARDLDRVKELSGTGGFAYSVTEIGTMTNKDADELKMKLLNSSIDISRAQIFIDTDFYRLIDVMLENFPAHLRLKTFSVTRATELNQASLEKIRTRAPLDLITTTASFDWVTITAKPDDAGDTGTPGRGGRR